jgi:hypothetical protein
VHCHASEFNCGNLTGLQDRTQIALVEGPQLSAGPAVNQDSDLSSVGESFLEPAGAGKKKAQIDSERGISMIYPTEQEVCR